MLLPDSPHRKPDITFPVRIAPKFEMLTICHGFPSQIGPYFLEGVAFLEEFYSHMKR